MVPGSLREGGRAAQITAAVNRVAMHRHSDGACAYTLVHTRTVGACTGRDIKKKNTHTHTQPNVDMPNRDEHKSKQSIQTQK